MSKYVVSMSEELALIGVSFRWRERGFCGCFGPKEGWRKERRDEWLCWKEREKVAEREVVEAAIVVVRWWLWVRKTYLVTEDKTVFPQLNDGRKEKISLHVPELMELSH